MEKNKMIKVIDCNGKEYEIEPIVTVMHNETLKKYMLHTDHSKDEKGNEKIYASMYDINEDGTYVLEPIKTDEERKLMQSFLEDLQRQVRTEH